MDSPHRSETSVDEASRSRGRRVLATVYDATAGRVTLEKIGRSQGLSQAAPLAPDDVLFRRKDAPERYQEHDIYRSHERNLPNSGRDVLPPSDLLHAVHTYTSQFYAALNLARRGRRNVDECSMDETALLAFGILLEEAGREVLGRKGHGVFTEPAAAAEEEEEEHIALGPRAGAERGVKRRRLDDD